MNPNGSSVTINSVVRAVSLFPGCTAYALRPVAVLGGGATRFRLYRAFHSAERRGLIRAEPNPIRKGSSVWYVE